jgi:hypothetical protein
MKLRSAPYIKEHVKGSYALKVQTPDRRPQNPRLQVPDPRLYTPNPGSVVNQASECGRNCAVAFFPRVGRSWRGETLIPRIGGQGIMPEWEPQTGDQPIIFQTK